MKKVLSILLSCTIMTSLLIGCSSDDDKKYNELAQKIEENEKLKSDIWEKEEISKLKSERDSYQKQLTFGFGITEEENEKIKQWISNREDKNTGAIGGRYEYRFFPTSIGVVCKIVDTTNNESFTFREL